MKRNVNFSWSLLLLILGMLTVTFNSYSQVDDSKSNARPVAE